MRRKLLILWLTLAVLPIAFAPAQQPGIIGDWREPGGSVIRIASCGPDLCATLVKIAPQSPTQFDLHNPDASMRSQRLCGLRIGYGFHLVDPNHANGGQLYDPKSGKLYRGEMTADGQYLNLRGYVGIRLFGRTEVWSRTAPVKPCT